MKSEIQKAYKEARSKRKKEVAQRLSKLRKLNKVTQKDVEDLTGIKQTTLSGYEIGKNEPNLEAIVRLADIYGVTVDHIICDPEKG